MLLLWCITYTYLQGWNDVSFHGSNQIPTPNIDALAYHGVILNSHYVQSTCSPSRSALMTGKYPMRIGTPHNRKTKNATVIIREICRNARRTYFGSGTSRSSSRKNNARLFPGECAFFASLLANLRNTKRFYLFNQELGYSTHLIGKWHLGMARWNDTPTYRGFDHHLGNLNGFVSYYDFLSTWTVSAL